MIPCLRANQTKFNIPLKKKKTFLLDRLYRMIPMSVTMNYNIWVIFFLCRWTRQLEKADRCGKIFLCTSTKFVRKIIY